MSNDLAISNNKRADNIKDAIYEIGGRKVMLDRDLASIYGVNNAIGQLRDETAKPRYKCEERAGGSSDSEAENKKETERDVIFSNPSLEGREAFQTSKKVRRLII